MFCPTCKGTKWRNADAWFDIIILPMVIEIEKEIKESDTRKKSILEKVLCSEEYNV